MQSWILERKIQVTQARIMEWYIRNEKKCYVSFSGGKDSTVLADITAQVCSLIGCKLVLWFSDTGIEYPEVREHVKKFPKYLEDKYNIEVELIMDYPKDRKGNRITFRDVILDKGYPVITKEISRDIGVAQNNPNGKTAEKFRKGSNYHKKYGDTWLLDKWAYLIKAPFHISNQCCTIMKKKPAHKFDRSYGLKPIIGTMACESVNRKSQWLKYGCNSFDAKSPASKPISFWKEQDVLKYIVKYDVPYPSVYGKIIMDSKGRYYTNALERTGCVFCGYGCHIEKEPNRFQRLKQTHPKLWEYCMKPIKEGGLGMREVLKYINIKIE